MYHLLETLLANTTTLVLVIVLGFVLLTLGADAEGYPRVRGLSRTVTHHRFRSVYQNRD